jgi:hypothetical protein
MYDPRGSSPLGVCRCVAYRPIRLDLPFPYLPQSIQHNKCAAIIHEGIQAVDFTPPKKIISGFIHAIVWCLYTHVMWLHKTLIPFYFFILYQSWSKQLLNLTIVTILGTFAQFRNSTIASSCLSARPSAWNSSAPIGRIFIKFDIWAFF